MIHKELIEKYLARMNFFTPGDFREHELGNVTASTTYSGQEDTVLTVEKFHEIIDKYRLPFVGYTVTYSMYEFLKEQSAVRKIKAIRQGFFPVFDIDRINPNQIEGVPTYIVSNQPCRFVKWTSRKLMNNFIKRKDAELRRK